MYFFVFFLEKRFFALNPKFLSENTFWGRNGNRQSKKNEGKNTRRKKKDSQRKKKGTQIVKKNKDKVLHSWW